jgi:hypothetical protein
VQPTASIHHNLNFYTDEKVPQEISNGLLMLSKPAL